MNVPADVMAKLALALGAPGEMKAEGVARLALERLRGDREWWVEVHDSDRDKWEFHSCGYRNALEAKATAESLEAQRNTPYRATELLRRIL